MLSFRTDSDIPGVEKLAVVAPGKAFLDFAWKPMDAISDAHSADLVHFPTDSCTYYEIRFSTFCHVFMRFHDAAIWRCLREGIPQKPDDAHRGPGNPRTGHRGH